MTACGFGKFFVGQVRGAGDQFVVVVLGDQDEFQSGSADETWNWSEYKNQTPWFYLISIW
jgi:hypothetical protein